jgi:hypothetical protein
MFRRSRRRIECGCDRLRAHARTYAKFLKDVLFVNVGSVGKRKDGDWRAWYALLEPGASEPVRFVRVEYDLKQVTDAIRRSDLPK